MKSERPMDPLNDLFIHHLFGSEEHKDISLEFINAVFAQKDQPKIVSLKLVNPFNIASFKIDKLSSVDIKAKTSDERTIIIEVQRQSQTYFTDRSLYYWAHNYQKQLKSAESFETLNPVICINLLDFTLHFVEKCGTFKTLLTNNTYFCRSREVFQNVKRIQVLYLTQNPHITQYDHIITL